MSEVYRCLPYLPGHLKHQLEALDKTALHTGRRLWRVTCECGVVLSEETTGPMQQVEMHLRELMETR